MRTAFFSCTFFSRVKSSRSSSSSSLLMYASTSSMRGMVTFSNAFTRRFVTLRASSMVRNAVCSDASLIINSRSVLYFSRQLLMARPPPARPMFSCGVSTSTSICENTGILTPAMLSVRPATRTDATGDPSKTFDLISPAAYSACVMEKKDEAHASDICDFVAAIFFAMSRNRAFSASPFFFSSSNPFFAALCLPLKVCRFIRVGGGRASAISASGKGAAVSTLTLAYGSKQAIV
mmetsp:Transcript_71857/g.144606  ORF Transcript_71857/g.144606 Transcript_71857/m.144606 type:complete len:235 (+) Transcript_71857:360-1064(+)